MLQFRFTKEMARRLMFHDTGIDVSEEHGQDEGCDNCDLTDDGSEHDDVLFDYTLEDPACESESDEDDESERLSDDESDGTIDSDSEGM